MTAVILALGSRGGVEPYANLGRGLIEAVHHVRMVTTQDFRRLVASRGIEMVALSAQSRPLLRRSRANVRRLIPGFRHISKSFVEVAAELVPAMAECDVILNQLPGGAFGSDVSEKYGQRQWRLATIPLESTDEFPVMGWPRRLSDLSGYNRATYAVSEPLAWLLMSGVVNPWRTEALGLAARSVTALRAAARRTVDGVLVGVSRHVLPRPADWGARIRITGY